MSASVGGYVFSSSLTSDRDDWYHVNKRLLKKKYPTKNVVRTVVNVKKIGINAYIIIVYDIAERSCVRLVSSRLNLESKINVIRRYWPVHCFRANVWKKKKNKNACDKKIKYCPGIYIRSTNNVSELSGAICLVDGWR